MKFFLTLLTLAVLAVGSARASTNIEGRAVMVNSAGELLAPSTFFEANSNALVAVVGSLSGLGGDLTSLSNGLINLGFAMSNAVFVLDSTRETFAVKSNRTYALAVWNATTCTLADVASTWSNALAGCSVCTVNPSPPMILAARPDLGSIRVELGVDLQWRNSIGGGVTNLSDIALPPRSYLLLTVGGASTTLTNGLWDGISTSQFVEATAATRPLDGYVHRHIRDLWLGFGGYTASDFITDVALVPHSDGDYFRPLIGTDTWYSAGGGDITNANGWLVHGGTTNADGVAIATDGYVIAPGVLDDSVRYGVARLVLGYASTGLVLKVESADSRGGTYTEEGAYSYGTTGLVVSTLWNDARWIKVSVETNLPPLPVPHSWTVTTGGLKGWQDWHDANRLTRMYGTSFRIDRADLDDEAVPLGQLRDTVAANSGQRWSLYPAENDVTLAGYSLVWNRWTAGEDGESFRLRYSDATVLQIWSGATVTPQVVGASMSSNLWRATVAAGPGFQPYPQWSTNLTDWTQLTTNEFTSTYPAITNYTYALSWTNSITGAYWRVVAVNRSGSTGTVSLASFDAPIASRGEVLRNISLVATNVPMAVTTNAAGNVTYTLSGLWSTNNFNPSGYATVSLLSSSLTNYARFVTAPASNSAAGAPRQWSWAVTGGTNWLYIYGATNWTRVQMDGASW